MEVPTGIIADLFGRKVNRIFGRVLALISITILLTANSFYFIALSFVFTALSYNLELGAGEALVYDSLKQLKIENQYMKICGKQEIFFQAGQVVAFLLGGYLATVNYKYVFFITLFFIFITIIQAFSFQEPHIEKNKISNKSIKTVLVNQLLQSIKVIKETKKLDSLLFLVK